MQKNTLKLFFKGFGPNPLKNSFNVSFGSLFYKGFACYCKMFELPFIIKEEVILLL